MAFVQLAEVVAVSDPYRVHPVTLDALASPIGLALDALPGSGTIEAGEVYSVRVGLTDGADGNAIVSAMVAVHDNGNDILWRSSIV